MYDDKRPWQYMKFHRFSAELLTKAFNYIDYFQLAIVPKDLCGRWFSIHAKKQTLETLLICQYMNKNI